MGLVVKEGIAFSLPFFVLSGIGILMHQSMLGAMFFLLACFMLYFFRLPRKVFPDDRVILAPADGKILQVVPVGEPFGYRVDIFMSLLNIHVNVAPISGKLEKCVYTPGRRHPASKEKASLYNENHYVEILGKDGLVGMRQIAGILARRIVFWKKTGDQITQGDPLGCIRFGSRVEVFLPPHCTLLVKKGDRVYVGKTFLARWSL